MLMRFVSISLLSSRSIRANPQHSVLTNSTRLVYSHPSSSYPSHIPQAQFSSSPMPLAYDEKPIIYKPRSGASTGTVIMLHGLGDTSGGWSDVAEMLQADPKLRSIKWILPTAPRRPITINGGMKMTGWYDIASLEEIVDREDAEGLRGSQAYIEGLVAKEAAEGTPSNKIVVAGFSQGGAVALMMLRSTMKLAGIVGLSTYLPLHQEGGIISEENRGTPIFMAHGTADQVVLFEYGNRSKEQLEKVGANVEFYVVPGMGHSAHPKELEAMAAFLAKVLA